MDRVDLWVEVPQVDHQKLSDDKIVSEPSENIRKKSDKGQRNSEKRFSAENKAKKSKRKNEFETGVMTNSEMGVKELKKIRRIIGKSKRYFKFRRRQAGLVRSRLSSRYQALSHHRRLGRRGKHRRKSYLGSFAIPAEIKEINNDYEK